MTVQLSVILVSYNTREMTLRCLAHVRQDLADCAHEIILVDNHSSDGSVDAVRRAYPDVIVIGNRENLGFGAANNQAMRIARGAYLMLVNTDAFLHPGASMAMLEHLQRDRSIGVVGPRVLNEDGSLQVSCHRFAAPLYAWMENLWLAKLLPRHSRYSDYRRWPHDRRRNVDYVIGACLMAPRSVYEKVGGFDERFFMYSEEADWQKRIRAAGWEVVFTPDAVVTHLGGASGRTDKARINRVFFESLDYYVYKHHGLSGLISLRMAMVVGCGLRSALWLVTGVLRPRRWALAWSKVRLASWLVFRQATSWRLPKHGTAC